MVGEATGGGGGGGREREREGCGDNVVEGVWQREGVGEERVQLRGCGGVREGYDRGWDIYGTVSCHSKILQMAIAAIESHWLYILISHTGIS